MMRFLLCLLFGMYSLHSSGQTLHLIMVSDVEDKRFGPISIYDEEALTRMFETVKSYLNYTLQVSYLNRSRFNSKAVLRSLDTLKTQPNDLIVWYYSGLGFYPPNRKSQYPSFRLKDFNSQPLTLDDVADRISKKGVRLAWVMADLRNAFPTYTVVLAPMLPIEDIRKLVVEKLFLEPCGVLKLTSSQPGKPTYTNKRRSNSAFMFSLTRSFYDVLHKTTLQTLRHVSLDSLIKSTQQGIDLELKLWIPKNTQQKMSWTLQPCTTLQRGAIRPVRSFEGIPTQDNLDSLLNSLVGVTDRAVRRAIVAKIRELFEENATIQLSTEGVNEQTKYTLEAFVQWLINPNPSVVAFSFLPYDTQRSADFKQFKSLKLTQVVRK